MQVFAGEPLAPSSDDSKSRKRARSANAGLTSAQSHDAVCMSRTTTWPANTDLPHLTEGWESQETLHTDLRPARKATAKQKRQRECLEKIQCIQAQYFSDIQCLKVISCYTIENLVQLRMLQDTGDPNFLF